MVAGDAIDSDVGVIIVVKVPLTGTCSSLLKLPKCLLSILDLPLRGYRLQKTCICNKLVAR